MGQPISETMRQQILKSGKVRRVTAEHVILTNGTVLDPQEFELEEHSMQFVLKLLRCGCMWSRHPAGLHVITGGRSVVYGDGRRQSFWSTPELCPHGTWSCEEQLSSLVRVL